MELKKVKLKEIVDIKGGKRLPKGHGYTLNGKYPYIRVADFKNKSIDISDLKYIDKATVELISKYIIHKDDVYISIAGSIGIVGIVPEFLDGANLTENAAKLVLKNNDLIMQEYLVEYLSSPQGQMQLDKQTITTSQPKLSLFRLGEVEIPILKIEKQKSIVLVLKKVQALVEKRKLQIQYLDELVKSKFIEMFGDPILNTKSFEKLTLKECCTKITDGTHDTPEKFENGKMLITERMFVRIK